MLLEENAHLAIEYVGALEVGRVAGRVHQLEARAGHVLVDLLRQLRPDEPVFVTGEEERGYARGRPPAHRLGDQRGLPDAQVIEEGERIGGERGWSRPTRQVR